MRRGEDCRQRGGCPGSTFPAGASNDPSRPARSTCPARQRLRFPSRARWRCWPRAWPACSATPGGSGGKCAKRKLVQISWTIQPGQRLTTGPEQNFAREEATNHVKPKGWRMIGHNASEGIEPRNFHRRTGPRVTSPGSQQRGIRQGECAAPCRGLSPWQVIQRFASELGRAMPLPTEASNKPDKGQAEVWRHGSRTNS